MYAGDIHPDILNNDISWEEIRLRDSDFSGPGWAASEARKRLVAAQAEAKQALSEYKALESEEQNAHRLKNARLKLEKAKHDYVKRIPPSKTWDEDTDDDNMNNDSFP